MNDFLKEKWLNIAEVAEYLGVNKDTIRNWLKNDSGIPAHKIGRQWKFKLTDLDEWIKSGRSSL